MSQNLQPSGWNSLFLKQNPFPSTPPRSPENVVWAGFSSLRAQFDNIFAEALTSDRTQVVLNWGEYGSGKTHAAVFFQSKQNMLSKTNSLLHDIYPFYIQTPREQEKADTLLYRTILEAIKFKQARKVIRDLIEKNGAENTLSQLQEIVGSEVLGKSIWLLGYERTRSGQLTLLNDQNSNDDWDLILEAYFHSQASKTDLRRLGLSRGIDSANDRFRILGGILSSIIGFDAINDLGNHNRLVLWIDEMENLIYFTSKYYLPFTQGLRELIDQLPNYFTIFLNITLASPEAFRDIETILGKAILDRKTHEVYFKEPSEEEAFLYVVELLRHYRTDDWKPDQTTETYPFTEEALKLLLSSIHTRTPRDINQVCSDVIQAACQDRNPSGERIIVDRDFVVGWINKQTEQNL